MKECVDWTGWVRNVDIRDKLQQEGGLDMVKGRQVKWKARLENMSMTPKMIFDGKVQGKSPKGRPRLRGTENSK